MSAALMQRVALRQLEPRLKSVLVAMANYAKDDGTQCWPAMLTIAAWVGKSVRRTQLAVRDLRTRGLIRVTRNHRPHRPTEYAFNLEAIDALPSAVRRRDRTQPGLFSGAESRFPQGDPVIGAEFSEFSTVSTGINRTFPVSKVIAGVARSVYPDPCTERSVLRVRARKRAG